MNGWKEFLTDLATNEEQETDTWFVSLVPPRPMGREKMIGFVREWIHRLSQALRIDEDDIECHDITAPQIEDGKWHVHLILKAPGLSKQNQSWWEEKWGQITGNKKVTTTPTYKTIPYDETRCIRRRPGEEEKRVVTHMREVWVDSRLNLVKYTGGGTCKIKQVGSNYISRNNQSYTCTPKGIASYLVKRHDPEYFIGQTI